MKLISFLFLVSALNALAENEIKKYYHGWSIENNQVLYEEKKWNISTTSNVTTYTQVEPDSDNTKLFYVKEKGEVKMVGEESILTMGKDSLVEGQYNFKDSIIVSYCGARNKACNITHEVCKDFRKKNDDFKACLLKGKDISVDLPALSEEQKRLIPKLHWTMETKVQLVDSVGYMPTRENDFLIRACIELEKYSKPDPFKRVETEVLDPWDSKATKQ